MTTPQEALQLAAQHLKSSNELLLTVKGGDFEKAFSQIGKNIDAIAVIIEAAQQPQALSDDRIAYLAQGFWSHKSMEEIEAEAHSYKFDVMGFARALLSVAHSPNDSPDHSIQLSLAEIQSGLDRVRWAEGLIRQLPEDHEGRNSWLLNYGNDSPKPGTEIRECNDCDWKGPLSETLMCGAVGPLCPKCRETTDVAAQPSAESDVTKDAERHRFMKEFNLMNGWTDEQLDREIAITKAVLNQSKQGGE